MSVWHRRVLMCFQLFVRNRDVWTDGLLPAACEITTPLISRRSPSQLFKRSRSQTSTQVRERRTDEVFMRMSSTVLCAFIVLAPVLTFSAAQTGCKGRCGAEYYRGYMCQCDYECLSYGECCEDYESKCTTKNSCKGRCGEMFKRGRLCSCDSDCVKYHQCCSDYKSHCDAGEAVLNKGIAQPFSKGNSADDPTVSASYPPDDLSKDQGDQILPSDATPEGDYGFTAEPTLESSTSQTTQADDSTSTLSSGEGTTESTDVGDVLTSAIPGATTVPHVSIQPTEPENSGQALEGDIVPVTSQTNPTEASSHEPDVTTTSFSTASYSSAEPTQNPTVLLTPAADLTPSPESTTSKPEPDNTENPSDASTSVASPGPGTSTELSMLTTQAPTSTATVEQDSQDITPETTTAEPVKVTSTMPKPSATSSVAQKPNTHEPPAAKPSVVKPSGPGAETQRDYQADDSNDTDLCSGRPVSAVTTLRNGTTVVFRGHYFWFLDSNRVPGPARGITQVWGVPSPVDTVFTRCNCQGKIYIFKGPQYWRFENDIMDPGYPQVIKTGFDGLRGHVTAALSVPEYRNRREAVYFFKRGGTVQKYSYELGNRPTCGKKVQYAIYAVHNRVARQAVPLLEAPINILKSWRGFPSTVTAAVSVPTNREPDGYKYYVFSRSKSYSVKMDGDHPAIAASTANTSPQSKDFFKCPKKV